MLASGVPGENRLENGIGRRHDDRLKRPQAATTEAGANPDKRTGASPEHRRCKSVGGVVRTPFTSIAVEMLWRGARR